MILHRLLSGVGTPLGAIMLSIELIYLAISFILGLTVFVAALFKPKSREIHTNSFSCL